jgi:hypothetical protein
MNSAVTLAHNRTQLASPYLTFSICRSIMASVPANVTMRFPSPSVVWNYVRTNHSFRRIVGLTFVYFLVCKLGLSLAIIHPSATAVWPETGIALACSDIRCGRASSWEPLRSI